MSGLEEGLQMKYLVIVFILVTTGAAQAKASDVNHIVCNEFKYTDRVTIDLDLETSRFLVTNVLPLSGDGDQFMGEGKFSRSPMREGGSFYITLYENSKRVGFLEATAAGRDSEPSYLNYKGVTYGDAYGFYCDFVSR